MFLLFYYFFQQPLIGFGDTMNAPSLPGKYQVTASIEINAAQDIVWALLQDFANVEWAPGVNKSYHIGHEKKGVGAGRHCELDGFGEIDEYITQWHEGIGYVYNVSALGPLHQAFSSWWLTSENGKTTLTVVFSYNIRFGLFGKVMHKLLMRGKLEKSLPLTLEGVKVEVNKEKHQLSALNARLAG